jgi:hypothetical protein
VIAKGEDEPSLDPARLGLGDRVVDLPFGVGARTAAASAPPNRWMVCGGSSVAASIVRAAPRFLATAARGDGWHMGDCEHVVVNAARLGPPRPRYRSSDALVPPPSCVHGRHRHARRAGNRDEH